MTADKMFEELGYEKEENESLITYKYFNWRIYFLKADKTVGKNMYDDESCFFTMQELKAINEKCKELGWLDE